MLFLNCYSIVTIFYAKNTSFKRPEAHKKNRYSCNGFFILIYFQLFSHNLFDYAVTAVFDF